MVMKDGLRQSAYPLLDELNDSEPKMGVYVVNRSDRQGNLAHDSCDLESND